MKITSLILSLLLLPSAVVAQSKCEIAKDGRMVLRPKFTCYECVLETATSIAGPWFVTNHVWGERQCAEIAFTLPKTNEAVRLWRLRIIQ